MRETLTRDQIVRAAIELLDADGIEGLSMRQLGARLGSAATAMYWHVQSKENLVVLAADAVWAEIALPDLTKVDWRAAATAMATDLYAMILRHPWLVPAMSTHLLYGPGKARHDDHLLGVYQAAGFRGAAAERAMTVAFTYVLGMAVGAAAEVAWRARMRRSGADADARVREVMAQVAEVASQFPRLRELGETWSETDATPALRYGLNTILDGLKTARLPCSPGH